jgi:MFS family permease
MSERAATATPLSVRQVLRIADFRRLAAAQLISDFGDGLTNLSLLLLVNALTGSTAALAAVAIALAVPHITVGLLAGVYVDRWDRRRIMLVSDLLRATLVLGFVVVGSADLLWLLVVLAVAQATVGTFFTPARAAFVTRIVPREGLMAANSVSQGSRLIAGVLGAAAAGLLVGGLGVAWPAFVVDSLTFVASFVLVLRVAADGRVVARGSAAGEHALRSMAAGLGLIARSPVLLGTLIAIAVTMLGLGAVNVLFVPLLANDLKVPTVWFGAIDLAQTASMVLVAGLVPALAARFRPTSIITGGLAGIAAVIMLLAFVGNLGHVVVLLFAAGWFVGPLTASVSTIVQTHAGDEWLGRVGASLNATVQAASIASMALAGIFGQLLGLRTAFLLAGIVVAVAAGVSVLMFRGTAAPAEANLADRSAPSVGHDISTSRVALIASDVSSPRQRRLGPGGTPGPGRFARSRPRPAKKPDAGTDALRAQQAPAGELRRKNEHGLPLCHS